MSYFLGVDTSNYTTSVALYDSDTGEIRQQKLLLPVAPGQAGLRQSDAVFHHTRQLPQMLEALCPQPVALQGVGVSARPRNADDSYMPCFLCGQGFARGLCAVCGVRLFETSHQVGHILAALYSADALHLLKAPFLAFHVSGGTTDCVLCEPDSQLLLKVTPVSTSLDLKAGQAVDRVGLLLGLRFPCGVALEQLAMQSTRHFRIRPVLRDGNCCLSGLENQCAQMLQKGESPADIARFCLCSISETILEMTRAAQTMRGALPLVYAGGVMSDRLIQDRLAEQVSAHFAAPAFSCDNAAGTALFAALSSRKESEAS